MSTRAATLARIKAGEGFIYAAQVEHCERGPRIKIGFSLMPLRRVYRDIANFANISAVRLLGYFPGSQRDELVLHNALHNALYGRHRCVKHGDDETYPLSIVTHPAIPYGLIFKPAVPESEAA